MPLAVAPVHREAPPSKRQKLNGSDEARKIPHVSRIFTPFRTIGLVSSAPFTSIPLGKTSFQITTSVGRCLQTYDLKRGLNLVFLTRPQTAADITASTAWKDKVFAAWGESEEAGARGLWVFKRGKKIEELSLPSDLTEPIKQILIFGSWIVGCCSTRIEVWRTVTHEHYTTLYTTHSYDGGNQITGGICNMPTYLNKILVGREDGRVEIWNVNSGKLIYTIQPPATNCGAVTALQPAPALSMVSIAYSEGSLIIHDIILDRTILDLHGGASSTPITSISFRTDELGAGEDGTEAGVMATAGKDSGDVTFWDLNGGGRIIGVLRGAHNPPLESGAAVHGGVCKVQFLLGQPVIITSGLDNSLKSWIFDGSSYSSVPRLLHSRSGHAAPVTRLLFLPTDADGADAGGKWLLSAGKDRSLWGWSLRRDGQSTELSQGNIRNKARKLGVLGGIALQNEPNTTLEDLKAPEITCIATCLNRDGGIGALAGRGPIWQKGKGTQKRPSNALASGATGWESVVTGHRGDRYARTWFWGRKKAGRWALETGDGKNVSSVAMSPCGTFAVTGSEGGAIDMYNLQSGHHRQAYPSKLTPTQARKLKIQLQGGGLDNHPAPHNLHPGLGKHTKAITGLAIDSLNTYIISTSLDGTIKFWDLSTGNLTAEIDWHPLTAITSLQYHPANDLIALTCTDDAIRIVDISTKRTVRELWGCQGGINDLCFSNDGRWIIAASGDCVIRTWDLPTGHLVDAMRMETQCTALAFSGTGEFLATAREGVVGVDIWNNKTLFGRVPTRRISVDDVAVMATPTASGEGGHTLIDGAFENTGQDDIGEDIVGTDSLEQLSKDMMTLSAVPKSKWQTLLHLDLIKQRNKPKEAPKQPEKAPFFLPSMEKPLHIAAAPERDEKPEESVAERSRIMKMNRLGGERPFTTLLRSGSEDEDFTPFINHLSLLPPSTVDLEIRSLSYSQRADENEHIHFIRALTLRLQAKRDYELVQAWMNVYLRLHAEVVSGDVEIRQLLAKWKEVQGREGRKVGQLVGWSVGVGAFLRGLA